MQRKGLDVSLPASQVDEDERAARRIERASPLPVRRHARARRAVRCLCCCLPPLVGPSVGGEPLSLPVAVRRRAPLPSCRA